ncbi:gamma-glutamyltranspeptidase 3-like protein isoform X1 [Tanacetum coccineum]
MAAIFSFLANRLSTEDSSAFQCHIHHTHDAVCGPLRLSLWVEGESWAWEHKRAYFSHSLDFVPGSLWGCGLTPMEKNSPWVGMAFGRDKRGRTKILLCSGENRSERRLGLIKRVQVDDSLNSHKDYNKALRAGDHAVDAAVSVALRGGVVNPMASGIGGTGEAHYNVSTQNMYRHNLDEIAGLYKAWLQHGRIPWKTLFQPAISLDKDGFIVAPYLANSLSRYAAGIKKDLGLKKVYAPNGNFLQSDETGYNYELGLI